MAVEHDSQSLFLEDDGTAERRILNEDEIMILSQNSTNWPAPNVWVFISQRLEHCNANAEVMGSNPVEVPKFFSDLFAITNVTIRSSFKKIHSFC